MATADTLLTAEEFGRLPDDGTPSELVRGRIVEMNVPIPRHGEICASVVIALGIHLAKHRTGRVVCNDGGVMTERDPDTVRGPDISYYSYQRLPPGPLPRRYLDVSPELAIEVRSYSDRWGPILTKVGEFLTAGVLIVCVIDEQTNSVFVYRDNEAEQVFRFDDEFSLPDIFADFRVPVAQFFE